MQILDRLFINGEWVDATGGQTIRVDNPATNQPIAEVQKASPEDIRAAIQSSEDAFQRVWRGTNASERSRLLHAMGDAIQKNLEMLAQTETDDVGKPIYESRNIDIASAAATFHYFADMSTEVLGTIKPSPYNEVLDYTLREPIGVVGAIIPWNFPFLTAARKVATALAAGNTMVIKPASWAPLSTILLGDIAQQAGLPAGVLNIIPAGGSDTGTAFAESPHMGEITFTGSTEIGRQLYASCVRGLKGCTLELGGKSPGVVLPDCDMAETIAGTLFGVFLNQGECCCALTRLIVHSAVYDEFVDKFVAGVRAIKIGMPRDEATRLGPLVHPEHLATVLDYVQTGKAEGAKLLCGGNRVMDGAMSNGNFMEPTVFADVTPDMRIWKEEIFGPVVTITRAESLDEAIHLANASDYGLAASVWTRDLKTAHSIAPKLRAGTVWFNLHNFVFPSAPYGGRGASGLGSELGKEGLLAMTRLKNVMVSLFPDGFRWY